MLFGDQSNIFCGKCNFVSRIIFSVYFLAAERGGYLRASQLVHTTYNCLASFCSAYKYLKIQCCSIASFWKLVIPPK
ncbi:hypothetical protein AB3S75_037724 [Citrus x aurantiifolia]